MVNFKSLDIKSLGDLMASIGETRFRASQIYRWIWKRGITSIDKMSDISKKTREKLKEIGYVGELNIKAYFPSKDGSVKSLFELEDGREIESVYIPDRDRKTVCVSVQVGCPMGCKFCATGSLGFTRNLKSWEIADQVLQVQKFMRSFLDEPELRITNVVYMGMGEPLVNLDEVKRSIYTLNSHIGLNIGSRRITISTVGIIPGIYELARFDRQVKLAISLHSAIQSKRAQIVPVAKAYPLEKLKKAIVQYFEQKKRWVTFEYLLLPGFNDSEEDIKALEEFVSGIPSKINIIPFNPYPGAIFKAPTEREIERFYRRLQKLPHTVTLRASKGSDVGGACGQLAKFKPTELILSRNN